MDANLFQCVRCGAEGEQRQGRGRRFTKCAHCRAHPHERTMAEIVAASPVHKDRVCLGCQSAFRPKRTDRLSYCSRACAFNAKREAAKARLEEDKRAKALASAARSDEVALRKLDREVKRLERIRSRVSECRTCAVPIPYAGMGIPRSYCGVACEKAGETWQKAKRTAKATRKARMRGVECETFDPIEVLSRDGWRCHICRRSTPQRLRGSMSLRAPELDHIIPLSKGGPHTRANTACACRGCNIAKGDSLIGQPLLFG